MVLDRGDPIRKDRSIRLLLLGGSNTAKDGYRAILSQEFERLMKAGELDPSSYVLNEGIPATLIPSFFGRRYKFQDSYPSHKWPNIIGLEFALNSGGEWEGARDLDVLINQLSQRWKEQGLNVPYFFIIDIMAVGMFYTRFPSKGASKSYPPHPYFDHIKTRRNYQIEIAKLNPPSSTKVNPSNWSGFSKGHQTGDYFIAIARFHGIPLVCMADALFPSFVRYFVKSVHSSPTNFNQKWPFSEDGLHLSTLGQTFLVHKLIMPVFDTYLLGRDYFEPMEPEVLSPAIMTFPASSYTHGNIFESFVSWGRPPSENTLRNVVISSSRQWKFLPTLYHESDERHICYGSTAPAAVANPARFRFSLNEFVCRRGGGRKSYAFCSVSISYLHSWNTSYVGSVLCNLYKDRGGGKSGRKVDASLFPQDGYFIDGNSIDGEEGSKMTTTIMHEHTMSRTLTGGNYILECKKTPAGFHPKEAKGISGVTKPISSKEAALGNNQLACFGELIFRSGL